MNELGISQAPFLNPYAAIEIDSRSIKVAVQGTF